MLPGAQCEGFQPALWKEASVVRLVGHQAQGLEEQVDNGRRTVVEGTRLAQVGGMNRESEDLWLLVLVPESHGGPEGPQALWTNFMNATQCLGCRQRLRWERNAFNSQEIPRTRVFILISDHLLFWSLQFLDDCRGCRQLSCSWWPCWLVSWSKENPPLGTHCSMVCLHGRGGLCVRLSTTCGTLFFTVAVNTLSHNWVRRCEVRRVFP